MKTRPLSVTIVGWFLIIAAAFSIFSLLTMTSNTAAMAVLEQSGLPIAFHMIIGLFGAVLSIVCGYGVLKGFDWARIVYVGWGVIGTLIGFVTSPFPSAIVLGLVFLAVFAFFLFRPTANAWFGKTYFGAGSGAQNP